MYTNKHYTSDERLILAKLALEEQDLTAKFGSLKACRIIAKKYGWDLSFAEERLDEADEVWAGETKSMTPAERKEWETLTRASEAD